MVPGEFKPRVYDSWNLNVVVEEVKRLNRITVDGAVVENTEAGIRITFPEVQKLYAKLFKVVPPGGSSSGSGTPPLGGGSLGSGSDTVPDTNPGGSGSDTGIGSGSGPVLLGGYRCNKTVYRWERVLMGRCMEWMNDPLGIVGSVELDPAFEANGRTITDGDVYELVQGFGWLDEVAPTPRIVQDWAFWAGGGTSTPPATRIQRVVVCFPSSGSLGPPGSGSV